MAAPNFEAALKRVLAWEGGFSNHPDDPGGVTLEGIIQRVYDADRLRRGLGKRPLTPQMRNTAEWTADRNRIYRAQYWNVVRGDELPEGVDLAVFDAAVNSGPVQAGRWLQRALRAAGVHPGAVDGHIGAATIAACAAHPNHEELVAAICANRLAMLRTLRTWSTFGTGWSRRVADIKKAATAMAAAKRLGAAPKLAASEQIIASAKADERDKKVTETPEGKSGTEQVTSGTAGGIGVTLWQYYDTASGWVSGISGLPDKWSKLLVGGLAALAIVIAILLLARAAYGLLRIWLDKRAQEKARVDHAEEAIIVADEDVPPVAELPKPKKKKKAKRSKRKRRL